MATVPGDPSNVTPMMPKWAQPTPADFLQAAAIMDGKGKFAGLTQQDQPMIEDSTRTARGVNVDRERALREMEFKRPPLDVDKVMRPGQDIPDPERGGTARRKVKGV